MRSAARAGLVLLVMLAGIVLPTAAAQACSCALGTPKEALDRADAVFLGQVVQRDVKRVDQGSGQAVPLGTQTTYTFTVDRVYKGDVDVDQRVASGTDGAACGISLTRGKSYLVFGTAGNVLGVKAAPGEYTTHLCSGTTRTTTAPAVYGDGELPRGAPPEESSPSPVPVEPAAVTSPSEVPTGVIVGAVVLGALALVVAAGFYHRRRRDAGSRTRL